MSETSPLPGILLVEDNPTSRAFFEAALKPLGVTVETAVCCHDALPLARTQRHGLWLFDVRLPDGSGIGLLNRLRELGLSTPAIAHTASDSGNEHAELVAAGFEQVLVKPLPASEVQAAVQNVLQLPSPARPEAIEGTPPADATPVWDDIAAGKALGGNRQHVAQLRGMFLTDLDRIRARVVAEWPRDRAAAGAELHKLRASCGFVGAMRLAAAVAALQQAPEQPERLADFDRAVRETLASSVSDDQPPD